LKDRREMQQLYRQREVAIIKIQSMFKPRLQRLRGKKIRIAYAKMDENLSKIHLKWRMMRKYRSARKIMTFFAELKTMFGKELSVAVKKKLHQIEIFQRRWKAYALWKSGYQMARVQSMKNMMDYYKKHWDDMVVIEVLSITCMLRLF